MDEVRDSILRLTFNQNLPKSIMDKVQTQIDQNNGGKGNGKHLGKQTQGKTNKKKIRNQSQTRTRVNLPGG